MTQVTLGEFHEDVEDSLGRADSLATVIPSRVQRAARWIERNYTFQYMRQLRELNVDPDAEFPHIVSLYDLEVKKIETLRIRDTDSDGSVIFSDPLRQVKPADRSNRPGGTPESYWLNGVSSLILNSTPDEDLILEANLVLFTKWGEGDNWTHWLLDNATDLLLARTLMSMSIRTRDPALFQSYKATLDLEIQSFTVAEEDLQSSEPVISIWEQPYPFRPAETRES